jgi:hypothetical protein
MIQGQGFCPSRQGGGNLFLISCSSLITRKKLTAAHSAVAGRRRNPKEIGTRRRISLARKLRSIPAGGSGQVPRELRIALRPAKACRFASGPGGRQGVVLVSYRATPCESFSNPTASRRALGGRLCGRRSRYRVTGRERTRHLFPVAQGDRAGLAR